MFNKILIANRGEIACRVARTARLMGIQSVAVYSDADRNALHVQACDEAVHIGAAPATESYLLGERMIAAALDTGAEAIHPGFGFLSENADFAEACAAHKLVFIGPEPAAIRAMGSKSAARQIMQSAGVPVLPGYDGDDQNEPHLLEQAQQVGFPLLIKAVSGGGGKGLRAVERQEDFADALAAVKRESLSSFGDDAVLLEHYLARARHIEIQIFADTHGGIVQLFDRDCSLQRRHQKVIEEAPAPNIDPAIRDAMAKAAIACAKAVDYVGAGTVEFLLARDGQFYFMEMNTRLQVEHPVTEMVTGQDLVAWQLKVAAGEALPCTQKALQCTGHAIEARIYAENPARDFLPSTGRLEFLQAPEINENIRVDTGVTQGDEISAWYDPMIAKLICHGENREQSLSRLKSALHRYAIIGPWNNISFLFDLCAHPAVRDGGTSTRFIDTHLDELIETQSSADENALICAALLELQDKLQVIQTRQQASADPWSPWAEPGGWRVGDARADCIKLRYQDELLEVWIHAQADGWHIQTPQKSYRVEALDAKEGELNLVIDGTICRCIVVQSEAAWQLLYHNRPYRFERAALSQIQESTGQRNDRLSSPMPGKLIACHVKAGQIVKQGQALMVIEAMKMEHAITAPHAGEIETINFALDDQLEEGDVLLSFKQ